MSDRVENFNLPDKRDRQQVTGSNLNRLDLYWELLISEGGYLDADRTIQILGVDSLAALDELRSQQAIIGLWWQDRYLYPAWQFLADGRILTGLPQVLRALASYSDWEKLQFLLSPNARLAEDKLPLDELRNGNLEVVMLTMANGMDE
jgi:hypothetical protein